MLLIIWYISSAVNKSIHINFAWGHEFPSRIRSSQTPLLKSLEIVTMPMSRCQPGIWKSSGKSTSEYENGVETSWFKITTEVPSTGGFLHSRIINISVIHIYVTNVCLLYKLYIFLLKSNNNSNIKICLVFTVGSKH